MVNTRTDAELAAAVQAAVDAMLPQIREQVREEYRTGAVASGSNPPPVTIHTWLERFNKQKPRSFEKAVAPVDAENWISHMEKIFDVMDCNDAFKTRLAVYKFEGDALAWWKAYKQAKGGDVTRAPYLTLASISKRLKTGEELRGAFISQSFDHVMCIHDYRICSGVGSVRNLESFVNRDELLQGPNDITMETRYRSDTQQNNIGVHIRKNDRLGSDTGRWWAGPSSNRLQEEQWCSSRLVHADKQQNAQSCLCTYSGSGPNTSADCFRIQDVFPEELQIPPNSSDVNYNMNSWSEVLFADVSPWGCTGSVSQEERTVIMNPGICPFSLTNAPSCIMELDEQFVWNLWDQGCYCGSLMIFCSSLSLKRNTRSLSRTVLQSFSSL
ncbi:hypothetical protein Tco_0646481 [Tanacetum coccineum]